MDRREFFKTTVGTLTAATLFGQSLQAGTIELAANNSMFQPGDILHVPRTKENFVVSCVDSGKITFSSPIRNTVHGNDEVILIGNTGVKDNTTESGWLKTKETFFKGKDIK